MSPRSLGAIPRGAPADCVNGLGELGELGSLSANHDAALALGNNFQFHAIHLDRGLIVNCVASPRHLSRPLLSVGQTILRQSLVVQMREYRKINQSQRFIGPIGWLPANERLPDAWGHHHAPGAQPHIDQFRQGWQEFCQSALLHPVVQVKGIPPPTRSTSAS